MNKWVKKYARLYTHFVWMERDTLEDICTLCKIILIYPKKKLKLRVKFCVTAIIIRVTLEVFARSVALKSEYHLIMSRQIITV